MTRQFDTLGLFPIEERVAVDNGDLVTSATWDPSSGQPTAVTAPSGATSSFTHDGLGRLTAEILPGDTHDLPTRRHTYHFAPGTRPSVVTEPRRVSGEPDVERTVQHLDGLDRPLARITHDDTGKAAILAEANIYSATDQIAEQIEGQALTASALEPGAVITLATSWPRTRSERDARITWSYDGAGRLLQQSSFDPTGTKISSALLHYDHADDPTAKFERGQLTAVDDDAGHATFTHDARGRVVHTSRRFVAHDGR